MVIVTKNQYILASKIHNINMDETVDRTEIRTSSGRFKTVKEKVWHINVIYSPEQTSNPNGQPTRDDVKECSVRLYGSVNAHKVFADLIQQIREQMPDQMYLDTALERLLSGIDFDQLKQDDIKCLKTMDDDEDWFAVKKVKKVKRLKRVNKVQKRKTK